MPKSMETWYANLVTYLMQQLSRYRHDIGKNILAIVIPTS